MTGTYKIRLPLDSAERWGSLGPEYFDRQWHLFVGTCRRLTAAKAAYSMNWQLGTGSPHVVIHAKGPCPKPRQVTKSMRPTLPVPLTAEECAKRAAVAQRGLLADVEAFTRQVSQWREGWSNGYSRWAYYHDPEIQARCKALGRALRVIHARQPLMGDLAHRSPNLADYKILDAAMGHVPRESKLSTYERSTGYYPTIVKRFTGGTLDKRANGRSEPDAKTDPLEGQAWYNLAMAPKPLLRQIEEARAEVEFWGECERLARDRVGEKRLEGLLR